VTKKRERVDVDDSVQEITPIPKKQKSTGLSSLAPILVKDEPGVTGVKRLLLDQDVDLMLLYQQVVGTGVVTDEEFWASRQVRTILLIPFNYASLLTVVNRV